jgi:hypothetical protein
MFLKAVPSQKPQNVASECCAAASSLHIPYVTIPLDEQHVVAVEQQWIIPPADFMEQHRAVRFEPVALPQDGRDLNGPAMVNAL